MITYLIAKNFQVHKKFSTKLAPITTFTGPTDSGKSSLIKALHWVMMNRPRGNSFINDPDLPAFVGIITEDGKLSRKKGKSVNNYVLNKQTLEAFGSDVPAEVQAFLNMNDLNFQFQFDNPYWFFVSAGEVSKQLNEIVDLEIIDSTLTKLTSKRRTAITAVSISTQKINDIKIELYGLEYVKQMGKEFDKLEAIETQINSESGERDSLRSLVTDVQQHIKETKTISAMGSACQKVIKTANKYQKINSEAETLSEFIMELKQNQAIAEQIIPNIDKLISIVDELEKINETCDNLSKCIDGIKIEQERIWKRGKRLKSEKEKLQKLMGKTCLLCGARIK